MNSVRLRNRDRSFQIDINIILILHTGVVDDDIKRCQIRILFFVADIETEVGIMLLRNRSFLPVKSGNIKAVFQKFLRNRLPDPGAGSCNKYTHNDNLPMKYYPHYTANRAYDPEEMARMQKRKTLQGESITKKERVSQNCNKQLTDFKRRSRVFGRGIIPQRPKTKEVQIC